MHPTWLLFLAIVSPALCGCLTLCIPRKLLALRVALASLGPVAAVALLAWFVHAHGMRSSIPPIEWVAQVHLELSFLTGTLSLFFAFLIATFGLLIVLYARAYFGPDANVLRRFYPCLLLFMSAMLGLVLSDCFMLLLMFWELTSVTSFILIGWNTSDREAVKKAAQALIVTGAGGLVLLAGLVLLGIDTQTWSITQLSNTNLLYEMTDHPRTYIGLLLVFIGACAKSAQMPFHFWLPGAMAAPTPVSAYLHSATMVKAGVYLVAILSYAGGNRTEWPLVLVPVGLATMLYGSFIALQKTDLKQIFAYCTVSQLGLLMASYGVPWFHASSRVNDDVLHLLSHALYKAPLFMLAGAVGHVVLTRELPQLHGLARGPRTHRILAALLIVAAYALASGPFTLAFAMKERLLDEVWTAYKMESPLFLAAVIAIVLAGALNVAIFLRLARTLLGRHTRESIDAVQHGDRDPHDPDKIDTHDEKSPWRMMLWLPAALLLIFQIIGGVYPPAASFFLSAILAGGQVELPSVFAAVSHAGAPLFLSLTAVALGAAIAFLPVLRGPMDDPYDRLFPWFLRTVTRGGRIFSLVQSGHLGVYIAAVSTAAVALFLWSIRGDASRLNWPTRLLDEPTSVLIIAGVLAALACAPALLMPLTQSRILRVLLLGATGVGVTCVYYTWHAPDLALTQIAIEVVSLVLFLLVLAKLPDEKPRAIRWTIMPRLLIALSVGAMMFWLTLSSSTGERPGTLGEYFLRNSDTGRDSAAVTQAQMQPGLIDRGALHRASFGTAPTEAPPAANLTLNKGGGGANVVNVILVDFRGFDTFGEIAVVGIATMGVWMLLRKRSALSRPAPTLAMTSPILRTASRLIIPVALMLAIFVYFKGHQSPGGGFVAGLVASIGLIIHRMAGGAEATASLRKKMRFSERVMIAAGLLLALATGTAALLFGLPFFTSNNGFLPLPGDVHGFHWATVMAFDLGVFFVVTASVLGVINALSDDRSGSKSEGGAA
jgi:multicomponent K+:H+ antiporter subunit A